MVRLAVLILAAFLVIGVPMANASNWGAAKTAENLRSSARANRRISLSARRKTSISTSSSVRSGRLQTRHSRTSFTPRA